MGTLSKPVAMSLGGIAAALLVLIGSAGPWARVWFVTVTGLDGDGKFTAALALACGALLAYRAARPESSRWIPLAAAAVFVVCLIFGSITSSIFSRSSTRLKMKRASSPFRLAGDSTLLC